jgi:ribosome-associated translation inhibitor RaiA
MEVEVRIQGTDLAEAIRRYAARRVRFALGRFAPRVGRVMVRVSDVNGARGGVDQCCHISVDFPPKGQVVMDQVDADLFIAIDRASARIGEALRREIQRTRETRTGRESVRVPA